MVKTRSIGGIRGARPTFHVLALLFPYGSSKRRFGPCSTGHLLIAAVRLCITPETKTYSPFPAVGPVLPSSHAPSLFPPDASFVPLIGPLLCKYGPAAIIACVHRRNGRETGQKCRETSPLDSNRLGSLLARSMLSQRMKGCFWETKRCFQWRSELVILFLWGPELTCRICSDRLQMASPRGPFCRSIPRT